MRDRFWLLACILCCLGSPLKAGGFEADFGFGGWSMPSRWAPLLISCDGAPAGAVVEIKRIDAKGHEGPVEVFPVGRFPRIECPVHVDDASYRLRIRLVANGELLAERNLHTGAKTFPGQVVLCVGLPEASRRAIAGSLQPLEPVLAIDLPSSRLPSLALELDGVAAIVLREGSGALSPAQQSALKGWSASGGRLIVLAESGLAREQPSLPAYWRERLALAPFGQDDRLSAGRIAAFAGARPAAGASSLEADFLVALVLVIWALALLLLSRRRRGFIWIGLIAVFLCFAAFPAARALDASHAGLGRLSERVLYLDGGYALVDASVTRLSPSWNIDLSGLMPSRSLRFSVGKAGDAAGSGKTESGILPGSGRPASLIHSLGIPAVSIKAGEAGSLELWAFVSGTAAAMPASSAAWSRTRGRELALVRAGDEPRWFAPGPNGWQALPAAPDFLGADAAWISALRRIRREQDFIVGRGISPDPVISLGGAGPADVLWALPLAARHGNPDGGDQP